jgi:uncharacterized membrane-anchored protein
VTADLTAHPWRGRILAELHARPFGVIKTPARVLHYAFATEAEGAAAERGAVAAFCAERGIPAPAPEARHARIDLPEVSLRWERHTEFTTHTWHFRAGSGAPFDPPADRLSDPMRLIPQPGPLLVAVDLHLLPESAVPQGPQGVFDERHLALAAAEEDGALIATTFAADAHGFVRILVVNRNLNPVQAGALVQRVLEIETYRTLALLGLPEAQELAPTIRRIEIELPRVLDEMRRSEGVEANHRLLDSLMALAAELEAGAARSLYRFGATRAYDELVRLRLTAIGETEVRGYQSWSEFLSRRLNPAMRTCASTETRQATLSEKLSRAAQLLRTRVNIDLERQNHGLLAAMNERVRAQLRLQQTVEGLSVAAISYYVASLAHLLFEGLHTAGAHINPTLATAVVVPFIVIAIALLVRRIRRHTG